MLRNAPAYVNYCVQWVNAKQPAADMVHYVEAADGTPSHSSLVDFIIEVEPLYCNGLDPSMVRILNVFPVPACFVHKNLYLGELHDYT